MADIYDLDPAVRIEEILNGDDIEPANRLEYFLKKAATEVPKPTSADAGKVVTVNEDGDGYVLGEGGGGGGALPPFTDSDAGKVLKIVTPVETVSVLPLQTVTTDAAGNASISGVDFSRLTDGDHVIIDFSGMLQYMATYLLAPTVGLYYENNLIVDSTTLYTAPLGAPGSNEIDVSAYAEMPLPPSAKWSNLTEVFIVRLNGNRADKTYSEIESALRSGRPCTLMIYQDDVIIGTGIVFNASYVPELESQYKYVVKYLTGTVVETMQCAAPNEVPFIV